jgi:hypothetical protein
LTPKILYRQVEFRFLQFTYFIDQMVHIEVCHRTHLVKILCEGSIAYPIKTGVGEKRNISLLGLIPSVPIGQVVGLSVYIAILLYSPKGNHVAFILLV